MSIHLARDGFQVGVKHRSATGTESTVEILPIACAKSLRLEFVSRSLFWRPGDGRYSRTSRNEWRA